MRRYDVCVISDSGLFWSINWTAQAEPKNSFTAAEIGSVDHILRHQGIRSPRDGQLFHRTLYTYGPTRNAGFRHFANGTDTTVAEVVDIVHFAFTVTDINLSFFITSMMSSLLRIPEPSISSRSRERLNFIRPTADES